MPDSPNPAPAAPGPGPVPFDLAVLRDAVGSDLDRLARYVELFASQTEAALAPLRAAIAAGDRQATRDLAHRLAGSCATVGAGAMAATAARLESAAREASPETLRTLGDQLEREYADAASSAREALEAARSDAGEAEAASP